MENGTIQDAEIELRFHRNALMQIEVECMQETFGVPHLNLKLELYNAVSVVHFALVEEEDFDGDEEYTYEDRKEEFFAGLKIAMPVIRFLVGERYTVEEQEALATTTCHGQCDEEHLWFFRHDLHRIGLDANDQRILNVFRTVYQP